MGLEKYFEGEKSEKSLIDWKEFWRKINKDYSKEYEIHHANILSNKLNATKGV